MRLLFIVPYTPTPIRTRPYHLLKYLSHAGHAITLATVYGNLQEQAALAQWRAAGMKILAASLSPTRALRNALYAVPRGEPFQAGYAWQPELMQSIVRELETQPFDVVHVEHLRGVWYGAAIQKHFANANRRAPIVWDSVDCITHLFEQASRASKRRLSRWMTRLELGRTRTYEKKLAHRFARTVVVSETERRAFCQLAPDACERITVVPNGVDVEYFKPSDSVREPATILFTGKMSYHANVTAAFFLIEEIMPRVWKSFPHARLQIVGQNPPPALQRRANAHIQITGFVEDLRPFLQRATLACAPIQYGAGTQNKVLEAMACGTAVVATPQAAAALALCPDADALLGTDANELSEQIGRVLENDALRHELERNGRRYVQEHHLWQNSVRVLETVYTRAMTDAVN